MKVIVRGARNCRDAASSASGNGKFVSGATIRTGGTVYSAVAKGSQKDRAPARQREYLLEPRHNPTPARTCTRLICALRK